MSDRRSARNCRPNARPLTPKTPSLAVEFFVRFSRFEFALKEYGFLCASRAAQPDWDAFVKLPEIGALYDKIAADNVSRYLIEHPPQKQISLNHMLAWKDERTPVSDMKRTCEMLRRVRNNLFHGGKKNDGNERDEQLLKASIAILDAMLSAHDGVRQLFEGHF